VCEREGGVSAIHSIGIASLYLLSLSYHSFPLFLILRKRKIHDGVDFREENGVKLMPLGGWKSLIPSKGENECNKGREGELSKLA
jgi:hypothetical protein